MKIYIQIFIYIYIYIFICVYIIYVQYIFQSWFCLLGFPWSDHFSKFSQRRIRRSRGHERNRISMLGVRLGWKRVERGEGGGGRGKGKGKSRHFCSEGCMCGHIGTRCFIPHRQSRKYLRPTSLSRVLIKYWVFFLNSASFAVDGPAIWRSFRKVRRTYTHLHRGKAANSQRDGNS